MTTLPPPSLKRRCHEIFQILFFHSDGTLGSHLIHMLPKKFLESSFRFALIVIRYDKYVIFLKIVGSKNCRNVFFLQREDSYCLR